LSALVVDDDLDMCWVLKVTLEFSGYAVTTAQTGEEALRLANRDTFPIAFIDVRLPDMDGLQLATRMAQRCGNTKIVVISGYYLPDDRSIVEALQTGRVYGFLAKPFQIEAIEAALAECGSRSRNADSPLPAGTPPLSTTVD
jgi:DNA-binding NtrC family response regulator